MRRLGSRSPVLKPGAWRDAGAGLTTVQTLQGNDEAPEVASGAQCGGCATANTFSMRRRRREGCRPEPEALR